MKCPSLGRVKDDMTATESQVALSLFLFFRRSVCRRWSETEDKVVISIGLFRVICLSSRLSDHPVGYCPGGVRRQCRVLATMALAQIRKASWCLPSTGMGSRAWKALLFGPRQDAPSAEGEPRGTSKVTHAAHHIMTSFNSKNRNTSSETIELNYLAETVEWNKRLYCMSWDTRC